MVPEPCQPRSGFSSPWWDFSLLPSAKADHQFAGLIYRSRLGRDIQIPITPPPVRANHSGVYRGTKRLLPSATPPTNVLMACQMSLQIFPTGFGKKHPFTTAKIRPDSIPTEDYRFSLRSPWPAAYEPSRTVTRPATPLPWQLCPGFRRAL